MPITPRKRTISDDVAVTPEKILRLAVNQSHWQDLSKQENILRDFDLCLKYGPSRGLTRLQRYNRAVKFDLDPPVEVLRALTSKESQISILDKHR